MVSGSAFILKNGTLPWQGIEKVLDIHVWVGRIAAFGGITTAFEMPNNHPKVTARDAFKERCAQKKF